jgi:hypothetical protein
MYSAVETLLVAFASLLSNAGRVLKVLVSLPDGVKGKLSMLARCWILYSITATCVFGLGLDRILLGSFDTV